MTQDTPKSPEAESAPTGKSKRLGDFSALVRVVRSASNSQEATVDGRRRLLADLCKLLGQQLSPPKNGMPANPTTPSPTPLPTFPPRTRQVLDLLLLGRSEKEVARELKMSVHTVHVHVKAIYRKLAVSSRGELMARCLGGLGGGTTHR